MYNGTDYEMFQINPIKEDIKLKEYNLWEQTPGDCYEIPTIAEYIPEEKKSDAAVVILPGGGYWGKAEHEGRGYSEFLNAAGICAFVVQYRTVSAGPHRFPLPLLDARRAVRTVRYNAEKYGIDKNKIAIMGSSAGGHLAALTSTYYKPIDFEGVDEIDKEDFIPNAQILCYPVISLLGKGIAHLGSGRNLLGDRHAELGEELSPDLIAEPGTPQAFIWHTSADPGVPVFNSLNYASRLHAVGTDVELHLYPRGGHGLGLANRSDDPDCRHVSLWTDSLLKWLAYIGYLTV